MIPMKRGILFTLINAAGFESAANKNSITKPMISTNTAKASRSGDLFLLIRLIAGMVNKSAIISPIPWITPASPAVKP